jgi:WD40 repeat protein
MGYAGKTQIQIWNANDGTLMRKIEQDPYATIVFSPDSSWLALGSQTQFRFFDTETWTPKHVIKRSVPSLSPPPSAFSSEADLAAIVPKNFLVDLVNFKTGESLATLTPPVAKHISDLCFSPDGTKLAVATEGNAIFLWNLAAIRAKLRELGLDWN